MWSGLFAIGFIVLPGVGLAQTKSEEPIHTTLCEILKAPEKFNFKMVQFRAAIHVAFEASWLSDGSCAASVHYTYESDPFTSGHEGQEYAFVPRVRDPQNGSWAIPTDLESTLDPQNPLFLKLRWKPVKTAPLVTVKRDAAFERMEKYLSERVPYSNGKRCFDCPLYEVNATIVGRFDHKDSPVVVFRSTETGLVTSEFGGFGHLGAALSQIVLQSVSDVVAEPIAPSVYEEKK
jgi:hypothetical protein